jgi:hypothetical protein
MQRVQVLTVALACAAAALLCPHAAAQSKPKTVWTLGVYAGQSPLRLRPAPGAATPALAASDVTDMSVDAVAHPFFVRKDGRFYMFFTAKDLKTDKGGIGLAESADGIRWKFRKTVIREPFVQSHPFVFEWRGQCYLVPEAHTETAVRLYRATSFPDEWKYEGNLLEGDHFISPTLTRHNGFWWLFTSPSGNRTLRLFYAAELKGPWTEHPKSPVVKEDLRTARPAGRPFVLNGSLYRLAQDCVPTYGRAARAFRIAELSPTAYAETMVDAPVVEASGKGWNSAGMHHVDALEVAPGKWIAVVDALGAP